MATLKELSLHEEKFVSGHRLCPGCGAGVVARLVMQSIEKPVLVGAATGCLEVSSTIFPYSSWNTPFIHSAFENVSATLSGVDAAYRSLKKQGKYDKELVFVAFGGDGGTYDIGFQSLSGAAERGHKILYICYNNQAYMNTGVQRSSATPMAASTSTSPSGKKSTGKIQWPKPLTEIMVAHEIPYVANTIPGRWNDLTKKVEKAITYDGFTFINVLTPCRLGWPHDPKLAMEITRLAAETCFWPLYEVEEGTYKLNYNPRDKKKPIIEWLKLQNRFAHLLKPENKALVDEIQSVVDSRWEALLKKCGL